jgi:hypothetical protein
MRGFVVAGGQFHDPVPDRVTLVKLRRERWGKEGVFDDLMREVVRQCVAAGLVTGKDLAVDGSVGCSTWSGIRSLSMTRLREEVDQTGWRAEWPSVSEYEGIGNRDEELPTHVSAYIGGNECD